MRAVPQFPHSVIYPGDVLCSFPVRHLIRLSMGAGATEYLTRFCPCHYEMVTVPIRCDSAYKMHCQDLGSAAVSAHLPGRPSTVALPVALPRCCLAGHTLRAATVRSRWLDAAPCCPSISKPR